ncbi:MAG: hypothetical protein KAI17_00795, partial [Thiotrichaceae bacterium]|nr:hypothetical protein [Thiotrichaceae bacterium]
IMDMPSIQQADNQAGTSLVNTDSTNNKESFWGRDGFTFGDVIDMFNPLQHLPVVSTYYREQANDDACEGSRLIGGILFGGLFGGATGVVSSLANSALRHETHQDVSEHLLELADESIDNLVDDVLNYSAVSASDKAESAVSTQEVKARTVVSDSAMMNPFFAQILDEYSTELPGSTSLESVSIQRSTEWGKV